MPTPVWGVELVGGPTDAMRLAAYRRLTEFTHPSWAIFRPLYPHSGGPFCALPRTADSVDPDQTSKINLGCAHGISQ